MTNLSSAVQAVASAYDNTPEKDTGNHRYLWLAAAFRVAANQLSYLLPFEDSARIDVADLLALADELEDQP